MDIDAQAAIDEGIKKTELDNQENQIAADEAAKDLGIDIGDDKEEEKSASSDDADEGSSANQKSGEVLYTADRISTHNTLNSLLNKNSYQSLTQSSSGLDSLIGASTSIDIAGDDTEYLKKLSEKVAEEADQSDQEAKDNEVKKEAMERARVQEELENRDDASTMSVKHARELAAKMNAQLDAGVAAAEERNELADKQLEQIKRDREDKESAKQDKFSLLQSMIHKKQSLT